MQISGEKIRYAIVSKEILKWKGESIKVKVKGEGGKVKVESGRIIDISFWKAGTGASIDVSPVLRCSFCHGKYNYPNGCRGKKLPLRPGLDGKVCATMSGLEIVPFPTCPLIVVMT